MECRQEITAQLVAKADCLLNEQVRHERIAQTLGLTRYIVDILDRNRHVHRLGALPPPVAYTIRNRPLIDATTIRMVERMLAVGILTQQEIAREAGISDTTVSEIAAGRRQPGTLMRVYVQQGERLLIEPIRCTVCRGMISIVPCRACQTRRQCSKSV